MPKALSRLERFQFSLTGSKAKCIKSQRLAIVARKLQHMTPKLLDEIRRENWKKLKEKDNGQTPLFVLACQAKGLCFDHQPPKGVAAGVVRLCTDLRFMNFDRIDWGRLQKYHAGEATCYPGGRAGIREYDNGRRGLSRVVERSANYGCVTHRDKIAYNIGNGWVVTRLWRDRFMLEGKPSKLKTVSEGKYIITQRDACRHLNHMGEKAYITRQSKDQIAAGSGEKGRTGKSVLIIDLGDGLGHYHVNVKYDFFGFHQKIKCIIDNIRDGRRQLLAAKELEALIEKGEANGVFVCARDSYRAGNCLPGTEAWASRHELDISKHYTIREIAALANGDARFVKAALIAGLRRHKSEMLRGFSVIADHRPQVS